MSDINPKLSRSPLTEALIEIRFSPHKDFALIVGELNSELKKYYPNIENLNVPDFPDSIPDAANIVRYRFFSADKKKLYNIGKGILSINSLNYSSFTDFTEDIKMVLEAHEKASEIRSISRIGLRYINKIDIEKNLKEYFNIDTILPADLQKYQERFQFTSMLKFDKKNLTIRFGLDPQTNKRIILDFDCYSKGIIENKLESIIKWSKESHKIIYDSFVKCLNAQYFKSLS